MKLRRLSVTAATSALLLVLPASTALAWECFVPTRSDAGGRGATHAENWISMREIMTGITAEMGTTLTDEQVATANALLAEIDISVDTAIFIGRLLPDAGKPGRGLDHVGHENFDYFDAVIGHVLFGAPVPTPPSGDHEH